MKFIDTPIDGVCLIELEPHGDERGFFARAFATEEFAARGLMDQVVHVNISANSELGTLRGMHLQREPRPDPKVVRCVAGAIFDVAVDLRPESSTYLGWTGHRLDTQNRLAMHVPPGCAHGFLTLEPASEIIYLMGEVHDPDLAAGIRWDDPAIGIEWPGQPRVISARDASYPDLEP